MKEMTIEVFSDMVCPWCKIGKKHLEDALEGWKANGGGQVSVTYRAYQLDPGTPVGGRPFAEAMGAKLGGPEGVVSATERVTQAGAASGVPFRFDRIERSPNTLLAHRLVALAPAELKQPLIAAIFKAYFEDGVDIGDPEQLIRIADAAGWDGGALRDRLAAGEGAEAVDADLARGRSIGVTGVPFFVINNKYAFSGAYPPAEMLRILNKASEPAAEA